MAKVHLNNSSVKKRRKSGKMHKIIRERNNNSHFKSKKRNSKIKKGLAKKRLILQKSMSKNTPRRKRISSLPSFLDSCQVVSETTLINISDDDSCITIPDDPRTPKATPARLAKGGMEDNGSSLIVISDEQTPEGRLDFANVFSNNFNKGNQPKESNHGSSDLCQPLTNMVVTKDFLDLNVETMDKENDFQTFPCSRNELNDVVYISDSDEPFPTSNTKKRRTARWHKSNTLIDLDETLITKTAPSPKRSRKHLFSEAVKVSTPKLTKVVTKPLLLSPIPASSSAQTIGKKRSAKTATETCPQKSKKNKQMIDMSSLEKLSELNKVLTAIPDLPNLLEKLKRKSNDNANNSESVILDDSDCISLDKTYSSSGQFISDNIYHVKKIKRVGLRPIVIDGSNVAMGHSNGRCFSVKGLKICIDYFKNRGHKVYAFVPSYRLKRTQSSDQELLTDLVKRELVFCTASRDVLGHKICSYDDRILVQVAAAMDAVIVSGDNYRDLMVEDHRLIPVIKNNLLMPTWVGDMLIFPDDPLGRTGPKLKSFLKY